MKSIFEMLRTWLGCFVGYSFYGGAGLFLVSISFPLVLIMSPIPGAFSFFLGFFLFYYTRFLTRVLLPLLQVYRVKEVSGFNKIPKNTPSIIVGNHCGKLDGPFILGEMKKTSALMKLKYATQPMYKILVNHLNFVSLDTSSNSTLEKSVNEARGVLKKGRNLLIYPEGKRAKSKRLLHFKDFAFRVSKETGYPIIPVVLYGKYPFMSGSLSSIFPNKKNTYVLRALDPVFVGKDENPADIAAKVRKIMIKELDSIEKEVENGK